MMRLSPYMNIYIYVYTDTFDRNNKCPTIDRRELESRQIDPHLHAMIRGTLNDCITYYSPFVDSLLVLHSNWVWKTFYHFIMKPVLYFSKFYQRVLLLDYEKDLQSYIDPTQLHLIDPKVNDLTYREMLLDFYSMAICRREEEEEEEKEEEDKDLMAKGNSNDNSNSSSNSNININSRSSNNDSNSNSNSNSNSRSIIDNPHDSFSHFCTVNRAILEYYRRSEFDTKFD